MTYHQASIETAPASAQVRDLAEYAKQNAIRYFM
jgi:hypothetical protein